MKRIITILAALFITANLTAQAPEMMSYQSVIRDASNNLVTTQAVGMQISILQGSASGTAVYEETQSPNTNANGLVSLEIGSGTVVSGDFTTIDWANGTYFIKTETDPTGGTTYTITGTSQLMSVPYALHSNTADSIVGGISFTEVDGSITNEIQTISRTGTTVTLSNGGGTFQDSVGVYTSGAGINITNNVISASGGSTLAIGDSHQGGIIFWLDASGQHGLIAATADQSAGIQWYNGTYRYTGTTGDGLYAGVMNTAMIIATQMADNQTGNFAAKVCTDYSIVDAGVTYGDWYLPSKYELNLLFLQKNVVGGFVGGSYWSSTEFDNVIAWRLGFNFGAQPNIDKSDTEAYVRAIRAF